MDQIIYQSVQLKCEPEQAFDLFTNNRLIESWLAILADVEAVDGGKYELFWKPDDPDNDSTIGCKVTKVIQNKLLAFEWRSPQQFKHFANTADPLTHVTVSFIPCKGGTEIHLVHSGWRSTEEWEEARQWQERAWSMAFNNLSTVMKTDNPDS